MDAIQVRRTGRSTQPMSTDAHPPEREDHRTTVVRLACGAALGEAVALVMGADTISTVAVVVTAAVLTWALRGLPHLATATALSLAGTALLVVLTSLMPSRPALPGALLAGVWLLGIVAAAAVSRLNDAVVSEPGTATVDILASLSALAWAFWFADRAPLGGREAVLQLVGSDDNAAWVDAAARALLTGPPAVAPETVAAYGPVLSTVLGTVATSADGPASTVVRTYGLLVLAALLAATTLVRRVSGADATARACVTWLAVAILVVAGNLYLGTRFGFLSAALLVVLALAAASLVAATEPRPRDGTASVARLSAATLVWAAASSWVGAVPAGALALLLIGVGIARGDAVRRQRGLTWLVLSSVVLLEAVLALHWWRVAPGAGGASGLIGAAGDVPAAELAPLVMAIAAVAAACVFDRRGARWGGLAHSVLLIGGYAGLVAAASWVQTRGLSYAALKTLFVAVLLCTALGLVAVAQAARPKNRPLISTVVGSVVVVSVTALAGPTGFTTLGTAWPRTVAAPGWLDPGLAITVPGQAVGCLPDPAALPDRRGSGLDAYWCTRWLSSLAGADGPAVIRWRAGVLDPASTSPVISDLDQAGAPRTVVVLGPDGLDRIGRGAVRLLSDRGVEVVRL